MDTHDTDALIADLGAAATQMLSVPPATRLERITCAVLASGMMAVLPQHYSPEKAADALVDFAKLIDARLRAAQSH